MSTPAATPLDSNDAPSWLVNGDQSWQLTAATFVGLQSVPGLVVLYAGIIKKKWAVNSAFMAFYGFAATLPVWCTWAYKMGFGSQWGSLPLVGTPGPVLTMDWELRHSTLPTAELVQGYNQATMVYFQFVFAAITVVITAGAYLGRMNFSAWMIFVPLWITLAYTVGAFSVWGGGFLYKLGIYDYSGGYVIHLSSGTAGWVGSYWIGPRTKKDQDENYPNNIILMMVGAGILWLGWNGFNGGDPYTASPDAGAAVLNTNLCTAVSVIVWTILDFLYFKKASIVGAVQGEITGLVAITPAAGFVAGWGAICLGLLSGSIPWVSMNILGRKKWFQAISDDTLGVFHTHLVAASVGGFFTGVLATVQGTAAFAIAPLGGAIDGNVRQLWVQIVGALFIVGYDAFMTSLIMLFIKYVCRVPLRMSEEELLVGDDAAHGEEAYALFYEGQRSHVYGDTGSWRQHIDEEGGGTMIMGKSAHSAAKDVEGSDGSGNGSGAAATAPKEEGTKID